MTAMINQMPNDEQNQLPLGWTWTELGEISQVSAGGTPSRSKKEYWNGSIPWVKIADIPESGVVAKTEEFISELGLANSSAKIFPSGTILFTIFATIGKVGILEIDAATNQAICGIRPFEGVDAKFLFHYLRYAGKKLETKTHGITQANINMTIAKRLPIALPPLTEQRCIVSKIDALFAESKTVHEALGRIPVLLRELRQSVLIKAFKGELASREMHDVPALELVDRSKRQEPHANRPRRHGRRKTTMEARDSTGPAELPEGWAWVRFEDIAFAQNGRSFPSKFYTDKGIRLLRPGNLHVSGRVVWTPQNTRYLPESFSDQYPEFLVRDNELIMNLTAQSLRDEFLGRVCMTDQETRCLLNQRQARIRTTEAIDIRYLFWVLKSPVFRNFVKGLESGTLIQHMFTWQVNEFMLPLAPLKEQKKVVRKIEECLAYADEVEKITELALNRISRIDQSILSKAFRGELVSQNPTDEPASVLLGRIKTTTKQGHGFQSKQANHMYKEIL